MSQQKAQLINATQNVTITGDANISGVTTAGNFIGSFSGTATGLSGTPNLTLGIVTATSYSGDGSNLTGVGSSAFVGQSTTSQSPTTTIDLSLGNVVYFTHDTDTTVAFANTSAVEQVKFVRVKDDTTTARTITWPDSIIWNGGTAPTLIDSSSAEDVQIFNLTTRDSGVTWYGYESMKNDPAEPPPPYELWSWGLNNQGSLGQNDTVDRSSPTQLPGTQWSHVSIGERSGDGVAVIDDNGNMFVWGNGNEGCLGLNNGSVDYSSPVQLPGTQWKRVYICYGYGASIATKSDGTLWAWGNNDLGELGLNDAVTRSSPHQIPGTQWDYDSLSANYGHWFCKKTDNSLWAAGYNTYGNLGQNNIIWRSSPIQIPGTQWARVEALYGPILATKTDGTLWGWGDSRSGVVRNDLVQRSSPTQIPGTQWSIEDNSIGGGRHYAMCIKTDGTLWSWGYNGNGQLGQNNVVHYSSPIQIPGTQWSETNVVAASNQSYVGGLCTKTDETLWAWGSNSFGRLGLNDLVNRSSPIQIPGTGWTKPVSGISQAAIKQG
jgi:alpha-tubulin suppressor-like RCC1 family protein